MKGMHSKDRATSTAAQKIALKVWRGLTVDYPHELYTTVLKQNETEIQTKGDHIKY